MNVAVLSLEIGDPRCDLLVERWADSSDIDYAARKGVGGRHSLLARAALRALLFKMSGKQTWLIAVDTDGKPFLSDEHGQPGPSISLTHGGDLIAVALGPVAARLGVDVEPHKPRDVLALAERAFGPMEHRLVAEGGPAAFYRLWTLREAMGKATGQGLSLAADGLDHVGDGPEEGCWFLPGWFLGHFFGKPDYSLAVAQELAEGNEAEVSFLTLDDMEI